MNFTIQSKEFGATDLAMYFQMNLSRLKSLGIEDECFGKEDEYTVNYVIGVDQEQDKVFLSLLIEEFTMDAVVSRAFFETMHWRWRPSLQRPFTTSF